MGKKLKAGKKGENAQYITRAAALRKLQISLADFRRLCILKNVYPREPKKKLNGKDKTYYHKKDILFILHEKLLEKFREIKVFKRKYKRAVARKEFSTAKILLKNKPEYTLHHLVKERFPTLVDALRDIDDALSSLAIFSVLAANDNLNISASKISTATTLFDEFLLFVTKTRCVRKAFISIKGFYIQVEIMGEFVLIVIPHAFCQNIPKHVDFKVLLTFLEFHTTLIKFLNFKLYALHSFAYPPKFDKTLKDCNGRFLAYEIDCMSKKDKSDSCDEHNKHVCELKNKQDQEENKTEKEENNEKNKQNNEEKQENENEEDEEDNKNELADFADDETVKELLNHSEETKEKQHLFDGLTFFVSREVPLIPVSVVILSCGGEVQWEGSQFDENSNCITHHVVDRHEHLINKSNHKSREYIQPQWIFDSLNSSVKLPVNLYLPSKTLPPHLSPFINDKDNGYVPKQREVLDKIINEFKNRNVATSENVVANENDESDEEDNLEIPSKNLANKFENAKNKTEITEKDSAESDLPQLTKKEKKELEERERSKMMLSKKHRRLLDRIEFGKERKKHNADKLMQKRRKIEVSTNKRKI